MNEILVSFVKREAKLNGELEKVLFYEKFQKFAQIQQNPIKRIQSHLVRNC